MKYVGDVLKELGQIIAQDFNEDLRPPKVGWDIILGGYASLLNAIYNAFSLPYEGQEKVAEAIEEFVKLRQSGEWDDPYGLDFRISRILQSYEKLQELMTQLAKKMLEDFSDPHSSPSFFYDTFSDYSYIMGCVKEVFSHQDEEAISKAFKSVEEFLQGKKRMWELKDELEEIVSKFNDEAEEVSYGKQEA
jgi:transcriptional regulator with PAS, ATPase and Fis domain